MLPKKPSVNITLSSTNLISKQKQQTPVTIKLISKKDERISIKNISQDKENTKLPIATSTILVGHIDLTYKNERYDVFIILALISLLIEESITTTPVIYPTTSNTSDQQATT